MLQCLNKEVLPKEPLDAELSEREENNENEKLLRSLITYHLKHVCCCITQI